jgi:hypothetical protein
VIGALETALARGGGAGVGPFLDPEQLGLDQVLRNGRAVHRNEGALRAFADPVQGAREHLLADTAFAQEQDCGVGVGHAAQHVTHRVEAGRDADDVALGEHGRVVRVGRSRSARGGRQAAREGFGLQVSDVLFGVVPFLHRLADDAAMVVAGGAALDLAEQHRAAHELAGVAGGVADLHPAHRLGADAVDPYVLLVLRGVPPDELPVVLAPFDVHLHLDDLDVDDALQRMQLRAGDEAAGVQSWPQLARQLRIDDARVVAHAHQHAHGRGVDQLHALVIEPDASFGRREVKPRHQIVDAGHVRAIGCAWARRFRARPARHLELGPCVQCIPSSSTRSPVAGRRDSLILLNPGPACAWFE